MKLFCECGGHMIGVGGISSTSVGYYSEPGHDHNDNCMCRLYRCVSC